MPPGKLASQAAHASRLSLLRYLRSLGTNSMMAMMDEFISSNLCGSAIVLRAKNLSQMLKAKEEAEAKGLPCALFSDSGHILLPHFTGEPIITALSIGPALREDIHPITKKFRCTK